MFIHCNWGIYFLFFWALTADFEFPLNILKTILKTLLVIAYKIQTKSRIAKTKTATTSKQWYWKKLRSRVGELSYGAPLCLSKYSVQNNSVSRGRSTLSLNTTDSSLTRSMYLFKCFRINWRNSTTFRYNFYDKISDCTSVPQWFHSERPELILQ